MGCVKARQALYRVSDMEIAIGKMNIFPTQGAEFSNPQPCIESQIDDGFGDSWYGQLDSVRAVPVPEG